MQLFFAFIFSIIPTRLHPQGQPPVLIKPTGSQEIILAVADAQPASKDKDGKLSGILKAFDKALWDDLSFSGYFKMAEKSYYPVQSLARPENVDYKAWSGYFK
jgi:hypothetical protein